MTIIKEGLELIKRWEGLRLEAYQDVGGVWTIGYGHTSAAGAPRVTPGLKITAAEAERILLKDLENVKKDLYSLVKVPLNPYQEASLMSWLYNLGKSKVAKSTLIRELNKGNYDRVPQELAKWVYVGKKKYQGLVNRRNAEIGLWTREQFVASAGVPAGTVPKFSLSDLTVEKASAGTGLLASLGAAFSSGPMAWALAAILLAAAGIFLYKYLRED